MQNIKDITEYIRDKIDQKESGVSCFIDFQKDVDSIDHEALLQRLWVMNIMGEKIERKLQCKYLGVYVDENLTFKNYIGYVTKN